MLKLSKNEKKTLYLFFLYLSIFFVSTTLLRYMTTAGIVDLSMFHAYTLLASCIFLLTIQLFQFQRKILALCFVFYGAYFFVLLCKVWAQSFVSEREILQTITISTVFCGYCFCVLYLSYLVRLSFFSKALKVLSCFLCVVGLLPPLVYGGYYIASGGNLLSPDSIIAVVQTHFSEAKDFLSEQNLMLWSLGFAYILLYFVFFIFCFSKIKPKLYSVKLVSLAFFVLLYATFFVLPKYQMNFFFGTLSNVVQTLKSFKLYHQKSANMQERQEFLKKTIQYADKDEVFIVVIGESATRDHMSAFEYNKLTTPWLEEMMRQENTIAFQNAYSNHVQTVQALQYALTSQNQYNDVKLENAYSLTETLQAADYDTYWISNQVRFLSYDMPITTIAEGAKHTIYINEHIGNKTMTTYYDEKLADTLSNLDQIKRGVVFFHLMGSHVVYSDRYPAKFHVFEDENAKQGSYDNSILYTDYVLSKLFAKASQNKNLSAFIYFSDHGEGIDDGLAHDSAQFTYQMSRIPFVVIFSDKFIQNKPNLFENLRKHKNNGWTSDLFYDFFVSIAGIKNAVSYENRYDISSEDYNITIDQLKTVHGELNISDDKLQ